MSVSDKLLRSGIMNFGSCTAWGYDLSPFQRDDLPRSGCLLEQLCVELHIFKVSTLKIIV